MLSMAVVRSSFGGVAIRFVLPFIWMTSMFAHNDQNKRRGKRRMLKITQRGQHEIATAAYTQPDAVTHQVAAPDCGGV